MARVTRETLEEIYRRLQGHYGPQDWWPGDSPFEVMVGAVLTQAAAWSNVERAIANLKAAGALSPQAIRRLPLEELAALVRPSGYFNAKARKLKALAEFLGRRFQDDIAAMARQDMEGLRRELLSVYGVGPETADDILLYALDMPAFVVDAYTVRVMSRLGLAPPRGRYEDYQALFTRRLPRDAALYQEYHALFVRHGKERCRRRPLCGGCPLLDMCPTGLAQVAPA